MTNSPGELSRPITYGVILFLFFLSLLPTLSVISLVLIVLIWLKEGHYKQSFKTLREQKVWWAFFLLYLFHVVSFLWTEDIRYGLFDLQVKVSFLICPVVFAGLSFSEADWKKIRAALVAGTTIALLICAIHAIGDFNRSGNKDVFFHDRFSFLVHPTYFMMYINLSMLFILYECFWLRSMNRKIRKIALAVLYFQLAGMFMLSARTALAVSLVTFLVYCFVLIKKKKLTRADALPWTSFFILATIFQIGVIKFYNRYDQVADLVRNPETKQENSASIRYHLWTIAAELISEHPVLGVGVGDIKEELVKKYIEHDYEYGIRNRISPHNEYLHTAVILGAIGELLLLLMLSMAFLLGWRNGDWMYVLFILIIALNAVTESILERQAGILFFAFMNSVFASRMTGNSVQASTS